MFWKKLGRSTLSIEVLGNTVYGTCMSSSGREVDELNQSDSTGTASAPAVARQTGTPPTAFLTPGFMMAALAGGRCGRQHQWWVQVPALHPTCRSYYCFGSCGPPRISRFCEGCHQPPELVGDPRVSTSSSLCVLSCFLWYSRLKVLLLLLSSSSLLLLSSLLLFLFTQ
jgi:hypothetical protein